MDTCPPIGSLGCPWNGRAAPKHTRIHKNGLEEMIARFANVVFWACTALALLLLAGYFHEWPGQTLFYQNETILLIGAVLVFLFGLALRYTLAGRGLW